jgi:hypothetical protein
VWAFVVFRGGSGTARADRRWASRVKLRGVGPWNRVAEVTRLGAELMVRVRRGCPSGRVVSVRLL